MDKVPASSISRRARLSIASTVAMLLLAAAVAPVGAEIEYAPASFRAVLSTARQIVIGDVVAVQGGGQVDPSVDGRSSRFTLQIRYVLRGAAPTVMEIWNLPSQRRDAVVSARQGDRIALALDGTDSAAAFRANAVAWVKGEPSGSDFETVDVGEVFAIAGRDPADSSIYPPGIPPWAALLMPSLLVVGSLVALLITRRRAGSRDALERPS